MEDTKKTKVQLIEELETLRKNASESKNATEQKNVEKQKNDKKDENDKNLSKKEENDENEEDMSFAKTKKKTIEKRTKISDSQFKFSIIIILVLGAILPIAGSIFLNQFLSGKSWVGIPSHSVLEALGSFTALSLGIFILLLQRVNKLPDYYLWVSCGLIGLGILDGFDGFASTGPTFLCIHDTSIMLTGFLFAMVWLSDRIDYPRLTSKLPIATAILAIFLGLFTICFGDVIDVAIGEETSSFVGGILFLFAALYFIDHYRSGRYVEDFLFATFCLLYGWAGLLFTFSHTWNADWWFWHILRLTSYFVIMSYMFLTFQRSEEKLLEQATLLDSAHEAIKVMDLNNHITYWNKGAERLYGWTEKDAIGKNVYDFLCKTEKDQKRFTEGKKSVLENGEWVGELCNTTKDNKDIFVESRWTLIQGNREEPRSILIINADITEKKKLEAQFLRAQRLESIGTLAGGIAHDLNNVMTPIMLSLEMLKEKFTDDESQRFITIIERNAQRGTDLIKRVVSFAKGIDCEHKVLQPSGIITDVKRMLRETFPKDIDINTDISGDLWTISGDSTQLQQVLMNLCVNSRDAMPKGGVLSISAKNILIDDNNRLINIDAHKGSYVEITVSDTGTGIPPEVVDRIFDPFFTTKDRGKGTGLGLSISMSIIKNHKGFIDVDSTVGKGTTFKIFIPAVKSDVKEVTTDVSALHEGSEELVMIVDDECSIRDMTARAIERHGYNTITADDGAEAVMMHSQNKGRIKVVVMDMMMPVMDGEDSIKNIRKIDPNVKIIAVSGIADRDKFKKISDKDIDIFLSKPYTVEKLLQAIHDALGK